MYKIYIESIHRNYKKVTLFKLENSIEITLDEIEGNVDLVWSIAELLKKHNLQPQDIQIYDFFKGPGSFTGLKNAAAIVNILNWAINETSLDQLKYPNYGGDPNIQKAKNPSKNDTMTM